MSTHYPFDDDTQVSTPENRFRRQLLKGAVGTVVVAALAYVGWTRYLFPAEMAAVPEPTKRGGDPGVKLGMVSDFSVGSPPKKVLLPIPGTDRQATYYVENLGSDQYRVLNAKCTHQGCAVEWKPGPQQFICPCHGAQFDLSGKVLAPPAPSALAVAATQVENGVLYLTA